VLLLHAVEGLLVAGLGLRHLNYQIILDLARVHLDLLVTRHTLLPLVFKVEKHVFAGLFATYRLVVALKKNLVKWGCF
jgi:hypothetical protein